MATYFVDYEGGASANIAAGGQGTTFATRVKSLSNCIAAVLAPGDNIKVMGIPAATTVGNATWTSGRLGTAITPTSTTNATPIVMTKAGHGLATGDTFLLAGHATNTKANGIWKASVSGNDVTMLNADGSNSVGNGVGGATGSFVKMSSAAVILDTAVTANIACCGNRGAKANWTASANVTDTVITSTYKEGGECQQVAIAAGFTTGLAAYFPTGTLDLSGYEQISFWFAQTAGTVGAVGSIQLKLCSDAAGVTAVDTFDIPLIATSNQWQACTVNKGSALGSSIQSIALYVVTDNGAQTFLIDNVFACKAASAADSLSLCSEISKSGETKWYPIQSINGPRVMLDGTTMTLPFGSPMVSGYWGTSGTGYMKKREPIKTTPTNGDVDVQAMQDSGTLANPLIVSGGWDRTDMSTQTLETVFSGQNGKGYGLRANNINYIQISNISFTRYSYGLHANWTVGSIFTIPNVSACQYAVNQGSGSDTDYIIGAAIGCQNGLYLLTGRLRVTLGAMIGVLGTALDGNQGYSMNQLTMNGPIVAGSNSNYGLSLANLGSMKIFMNGYQVIGFDTGAYFSSYGDNEIYDAIFDNSISRDVMNYGTNDAKNYLIRCQLNHATNKIINYPSGSWAASTLYAQGTEGDSNLRMIKNQYATIIPQADVRHTASGTAWKISLLDPYSMISSRWPFSFPIAQVACNAGSAVTCNLYMRRDNTGLTAKLVCKGAQILGVPSDVTSDLAGSADTWYMVSITFTPTEIGVVEITVECYGGTTYNLYLDDFSTSQV